MNYYCLHLIEECLLANMSTFCFWLPFLCNPPPKVRTVGLSWPIRSYEATHNGVKLRRNGWNMACQEVRMLIKTALAQHTLSHLYICIGTAIRTLYRVRLRLHIMTQSTSPQALNSTFKTAALATQLNVMQNMICTFINVAAVVANC